MSSPNLVGLDAPQVWDTDSAFRHLHTLGSADTKRAAERRLHKLAILPTELRVDDLRDEFGRPPTPSVLNWEVEEARNKRRLVLFAQLKDLPGGHPCLHINDARGARYWVPLENPIVDSLQISATFRKLQMNLAKSISVFPHGSLTAFCRQPLTQPGLAIGILSYAPALNLAAEQRALRQGLAQNHETATHLDRLEAESIFILREAVAEAENPVMLYSIGKDSSVMLHLARKAFYPGSPPFPLLHVDTRWKFQEMYLFREHMARVSNTELLTYVNPEAIEKNINPFDHGSALHTSITKTEGLKLALDHYKCDVVFGGARRDEEKSRAKERVFSFRSQAHRWDPKKQRPEIWDIYNTKKHKGESIRVFPLSNWTEIDVWHYIYRENIPIVPLYFAKERPVVVRDGLILMVDDARMHLLPNENIERRKVRFRTLGCYPLTGAIESSAETLPQIIVELLRTRTSERQGRAIDVDASGSMERKKREGYF